MLSSGSLHISGLHWDNSTIGVSHQSSMVVRVVSSIGSDRVDGTSSSSVGNLGSINLSSVDRHNSPVSMTDQSPGVSSHIRIGSIGVSGSISNGTSGLKVGSLSGSHLGGVCWDHGAVGVGHQLGGADCDSGGENLERREKDEF